MNLNSPFMAENRRSIIILNHYCAPGFLESDLSQVFCGVGVFVLLW